MSLGAKLRPLQNIIFASATLNDMEQLDIFESPDGLIANYSTDCRECIQENSDHTLIYILSGQLEVDEHGKKTILHPGECVFIRRDNRIRLQKQGSQEKPYDSVVLRFSKSFLRESYQKIDRRELPAISKRAKTSIQILPADRPDIRSLFESVIPYFEAGKKPGNDILHLKMTEALYVLLSTDTNLYASLFDFVDPWKIDIIAYLNDNYMYDLTMKEIASYTGRSLATFKRDFAKVSDVTPRKWIIRRRLEAAHEMILKGNRNISEICYDTGFKNLSHFSRIYKERYGTPPSR